MNNVHEDAPVVFQTRWALSFLRGPLTREQIQTLMQGRVGRDKLAGQTPAQRRAHQPAMVGLIQSCRRACRSDFSSSGGTPDSPLVYSPVLIAAAKIHYAQTTKQVDATEEIVATLLVENSLPADAWSEARLEAGDPPEFASSPADGAAFAALPSELALPKTYTRLAADLKEHLYRTRRLTLWRSAALETDLAPGESEGDFRIRLLQASHEQRDLQVEKLRAKYAPKLASLQDQVRRAEQKLQKEQQQASGQTMQSVISFGASVLGAMFGRKLASSANVTRAASTARAASRASRERSDVAHAAESLGALRVRLADLEAQFEKDAQEVRDAYSPHGIELEQLEIKPKKGDIKVESVVLAWSA